MVGAKLVKIDKFCPLTHVALGSSPLQPSFFICIIISFVAAWLARDTARASSVHSLQEMTNRVKDKRHPWMRLSGTQSKLYGLLSPTT